MPAVPKVWRPVTLRAEWGSPAPLFPKGFHRVMGAVKKHLAPPRPPHPGPCPGVPPVLVKKVTRAAWG